MPVTIDERRTQLIAQCKAVAHMARVLMLMHEDIAKMHTEMPCEPLDGLIDIGGERTAFLMEMLGDALNNMDAVDSDEDDWVNPVFHKAHQLWPQKR